MGKMVAGRGYIHMQRTKEQYDHDDVKRCRWIGLSSSPQHCGFSENVRCAGEHQSDKTHCTDRPTIEHQG